jgi:hypothetical protein
MRHADNHLRLDPFRSVDTAVNGNGERLIDPLDQPRRSAAFEPVIRLLVLKAVDEGLAEKSKLVVDSVAEARIAERGQRVEKTRGETSETAIAQRSVRF